MNRLKNESVFQRKLRASIGYSYFKQCRLKKNHGNEYSEKGVADLDGHIKGLYIAIECKMWKGRPSTEQVAFLRSVLNTGGLGIFAIYRYDDDTREHTVSWVPADFPFSYRVKSRMMWPVSKLISVPRDPANPNEGRTVEVFDCSLLYPLMEMRRNV